MDCGYYDSFVFGWFLAGAAAGFVTHNLLLDQFPCLRKTQTIVHYIPIYPDEYINQDDSGEENEDEEDDEDDDNGEDDDNEEDDTGEGTSEETSEDTSEETSEDSQESPVLNRFKEGDRVTVYLPDGQYEPSFGWGGVAKDDVGVIVSDASEYFRGKLCYRVDFPNHKYWLALSNEIQKVSS